MGARAVAKRGFGCARSGVGQGRSHVVSGELELVPEKNVRQDVPGSTEEIA
jgi:hypothetical protein